MWTHRRADLMSRSTQRDCSWSANGRRGLSGTILSCWRNSARSCTENDESWRIINGSNGRNLDASEFVKKTGYSLCHSWFTCVHMFVIYVQLWRTTCTQFWSISNGPFSILIQSFILRISNKCAFINISKPAFSSLLIVSKSRDDQ